MEDARAHALGAYKSSSFADINAFTDIVARINLGSQNHVKVGLRPPQSLVLADG